MMSLILVCGGIFLGWMVSNRKYRRMLGVWISWFGNFVQSTAKPEHTQSPPYRMETPEQTDKTPKV